MVYTCLAVMKTIAYLHLPDMVGMADALEHFRDTLWRNKMTLSHLSLFEQRFQVACGTWSLNMRAEYFTGDSKWTSIVLSPSLRAAFTFQTYLKRTRSTNAVKKH